MKKTYGYARVSTREQHLDRQLKALMDAGVEERDIITDKVSGKDLEREGYQSLKNHFLRDGDTLIVKSLDRLSRRKIDIKKELNTSGSTTFGSKSLTSRLPWWSFLMSRTGFLR